MKLFFIGIGGTGLRPLAEMARQAGYEVDGYDDAEYSDSEPTLAEVKQALATADWVIYSSAIPASRPLRQAAAELGLKTTKRDEFINFFLADKGLKLCAVAGSHGKTTTTAMIIWACHELGWPVSYLVGSTLPWGSAGHYDEK